MTLNELLPVIKRAAGSVAFQWPGIIEADDVEQSIYLRLLESDGSVEKILAMDTRARYRAIVGIGHQVASQERTDYDHFKGSYNYSVAEVKDLLKQGILLVPPAHFSAELLDMQDALTDLAERTPQYADAILSRYVQEVVPQAGADKKRLSDALTSLSDEMNKVSRRRFAERDGGPGSREVLSNAQAYATSSDQYGGEQFDWERK
ncbi:sigma-K factor [Mycobacterium phage MyraDee]|uniref:Helix-turn-helix DNA binding domain protein n=1 Tax=Mycobacterium phage MyraDee TaxID=2024303 RepID=A0A222Z080_9CAUD|nr:sigma-K factor [Mycobacterium phage MyraDee]ASR77156.1 helix-turn-helix DNA binding domain protein [Mycobacterium phage MyraDee]